MVVQIPPRGIGDVFRGERGVYEFLGGGIPYYRDRDKGDVELFSMMQGQILERCEDVAYEEQAVVFWRSIRWRPRLVLRPRLRLALRPRLRRRRLTVDDGIGGAHLQRLWGRRHCH